ncbi:MULTISPECIES: hypothetical protein [Cyanophyceae]|uniref:hypothetical protein n=1 Tax=Cyanophyceae TaxID=3028117 RepID=UPI00168677DB|nr:MULTISPECIES: hypothetical protein [Cyanophyceae]MBD1916282.1 hypothetical protein [Phormidium sp. FACHB-77]MBD2028408.1 hypothetical protein [Phormidium sp. FACHB-322]MBD2051887.1 hypothetical protein [Leptolyngbya sp. FACHB-60]
MGKQVSASRKRPWLGSAVGALVGGVGQYLIVVLFFYYVFNWGGPFFRNHVGVSLPVLVSSYPAWIFFGLSAGLGGLGGVLGGTTRRLARGAALGGGTVGLVYLALVVVPLNRMIGLSSGDVTDYSIDARAVALSLVATVVWGAIAGTSAAAIRRSSLSRP